MNPSSTDGFIPLLSVSCKATCGFAESKSTVPTACHPENRLISYNPKKTCYKVKLHIVYIKVNFGATPSILLLS